MAQDSLGRRVKDSREAAQALIGACDAALERVLTSGAVERASALDLLTADAFVTYAFEAAADDPTTISARADEAMRIVSARAVKFLDSEHTDGATT